MKKVQFIGLVAALILAACKNNSITVSGTVERDLDSIRITAMLNDNNDTLLAIVPVVDGNYKWESKVDSVCILRVYFGEGGRDFYRVICEPGNIVLNIPTEGDAYPSGTPLNDSIQAYHNAYLDFCDKAKAIEAQIDAAQADEERDSLIQQRQQAWKDYEACRAGFLNRHTSDMFGIYLLRDFQLYFSPELIEEATKQLRDNFPDHFWATFIAGRVEGQVRACPGRQYTDLKMPTPDGGELSLSDIVPNNRYTFIDFWASWCGPCCAEIPHVKAAWEKYHDKGLEIVGVSFDGDAEAWRGAIAKYGMSWPHMSDLKGWGCEASSVYGISGIPFTILVGQDGIIIANNLRGDELMKKMAELLGEL